MRIDRIRILAIATIICGVFYFYANLLAPQLIPRSLRVGVTRRPITLLLLGTDLTFDAVTGKQLSGTEGRTDSILLVRIDPARYKVKLLSIPRDSFVAIPGHGRQKINAAHVYGGVPLLEETLTALTGRKIDRFMEVNPSAVGKLVDLLGGISLDVEKDLYYMDYAQDLKINLKEGRQKLSGVQAEGYLRFRHDAMGDIGRIERQQKFMQSLFRSFARPVNLLKAPLIFQTALNCVKTDLSVAETVRLLNFLRALSPRDIQTFTASGEPGSSDYAGSVWVLNQEGLEKVVRDYF